MSVDDEDRPRAARSLLGRVVDMAKQAVLRPSRPPPPATPIPSWRSPAFDPPQSDPMMPSPTASTVAAEPEADASVRVSWRVDEVGILGARRLLEGDGHLTARVVVIRPDALGLVASEVHDQRVHSTGGIVLHDLPAGARAVAAIGLKAGEAFVSIAHAPTLVVPG